MHIHLKLFYSLSNSPKFPYICFGLLTDHLQGVTKYTYFASICSVCSDLDITICVLHVRSFLLPPSEEGLITICLDLFTAGGETMSMSLGFSLLYMLVHPNVQKAVQKELDAVVGRDRSPTLQDRAR